MSCQQSNSKQCGQQFSQKLVNQQPVYDKKLKIHRPKKKQNAGKWI